MKRFPWRVVMSAVLTLMLAGCGHDPTPAPDSSEPKEAAEMAGKVQVEVLSISIATGKQVYVPFKGNQFGTRNNCSCEGHNLSA